MIRKLVRWRTVLMLLFIGSLLWFINNPSMQSRPVEMRQEVIIYNTIDQVSMSILKLVLIHDRLFGACLFVFRTFDRN